jgi:hypothetical protein
MHFQDCRKWGKLGKNAESPGKFKEKIEGISCNYRRSGNPALVPIFKQQNSKTNREKRVRHPNLKAKVKFL